MGKKEEAGKIVEEIRRDRRSGATALGERALDAMALSRSAAPALLRARPSMPVIAAAVRLARRRGVAAARRALRSAMRGLSRRARAFLPAGARYIVHSRSGTVDEVIRAVGGRVVRTFPADVALVGADALYPGGDFVNARGTRAFAVRARKAGAAVFVVATRLKRVRKAIPLEKGFERVPGHVVHAVLTETGIRYPRSAPAGVEPSWLIRRAVTGESRRGSRTEFPRCGTRG